MILCCCNGLYLLWSYTGAGHLVWNPSTNESVELPDHEYPAATRSTYGLAFDSINDDYKILKIDNKGSSTSLNKIFALKSGCWRCIDNHPRSFVNSVWGEDSLAFGDIVAGGNIQYSRQSAILKAWHFRITRNALCLLY
ncbi:hypothetical protein T459_12778 [Capsicum annuum]|uniref:F-box associated beta-propeller type 3 domain-containing protein n=1 Tax=Capsicum annuum TaxID=4072 RepID=A0A2G2ZQU9_CAPAN|nr:hypothetical protein T459_12778 [Capsicum annuum]